MVEPVERVRELLERRGWVQNNWQSAEGLCILGAFEHCYGVGFVPSDESAEVARRQLGAERFAEASSAVRRVADAAGGEDEVSAWEEALIRIIEFNDAPETTYEDVILTLKRAASQESPG